MIFISAAIAAGAAYSGSMTLRAASRVFGRGRFTILAAAFSGAVLACSGSGSGPSMHSAMAVTPHSALVDVPVDVTVRRVPAGAKVTIAAAAKDHDGTTWTSSAIFTATSAGTVSSTQASTGGSYTGVDPMGLFALMAPPPAGSSTSRFLSNGYDVEFQARVGGKLAAVGTAHREDPKTLVLEEDLHPGAGGIYGELYQPAKATGTRPGVLLFGGSEGGLYPGLSAQAAALAAHGYPTLAIAYFNEPGLPSGLANIPLEYFVKALALLRRQPGVDPGHVFVDGASRGGEAALLLGATFPDLVNGVIAGVPSGQVVSGFPDATKAAWTLAGKPVPYVHRDSGGRVVPASVAPATIAVEKIRGPILMTCGGQDRIWRSCPYVDGIARRLRAHQFRHPVIAKQYPDAGHLAGTMSGYISATDDYYTRFGGTSAGNAFAVGDGHAALLAFLASQ